MRGCIRDSWVADVDTEDCILAFSVAGLSGADTYPSRALDRSPLAPAVGHAWALHIRGNLDSWLDSWAANLLNSVTKDP